MKNSGTYFTPSCLKDLALHKLKEYVTSILHYFIETPSHKTVSHFQTISVDPICKRLEEYFESTLPSAYSNDVVNQLMNCLSDCVLRIHVQGPDPDVFDNWCSEEVTKDLGETKPLVNMYDSTGCRRHNPELYRFSSYYLEDPQEGDKIECSDVSIFGRQDKTFFERVKDVVLGNQEALYMEWCYSAAQSILNAVCQSSITKFISKKGISLLNEALLPKLKNLEELSVCFTWYSLPTALLSKCLKSAHGLEDVAFPMCSDELVNIISRSCTGLKRLKISGSEEVTNKSVKSILLLDKLEELDIANTWITEKGLEKLCRGLSEEESSGGRFKKLSFSIYELSSNLEMLVETFSNLTALSICPHDPYISLIALKNLKALTDLSIRGQMFLEKELFECIGAQILNLSFLEFLELDLYFISEYFPNLRSLVLCQDLVQKLRGPLASEYADKNPPPDFHTIEQLGLILEDLDTMCYISSLCNNLKMFKLEEKTNPHHVLKLATQLLEMMKEKCLQEINIADKIRILSRGKNVLVIKYDESWDEHADKEVDFEHYSNVLNVRADQPLDGLLDSAWWWTEYHDVCNENYVVKVLW
ncbi:hypothetical protein C0J52_14912 [Blattella germanica]|nr:hypothetical protein C0J52_14912 [Blattella germanica]